LEERRFSTWLSLMYAEQLGRKYSGVKLDVADEASASALGSEVIYDTNEGPVVITERGKLVFVSESFDLETARKLADLLIDGQGTGETRAAGVTLPDTGLSNSWVKFMHSCGIMKAALLH
jgi:hypothetical protein